MEATAKRAAEFLNRRFADPKESLTRDSASQSGFVKTKRSYCTILIVSSSSTSRVMLQSST